MKAVVAIDWILSIGASISMGLATQNVWFAAAVWCCLWFLKNPRDWE